MTNLTELRDKLRAREKVVTLITRGDLLAEHEQVSSALRDAYNRPTASLGDTTTARLAQRVRDLESEIADTSIVLRVRGLGRNQFRRLLDQHPAPDGKDGYDPDTFPVALIAACLVDPALTENEVRDLGDLLTDGQWDELFEAAFVASREVDGVPFNALASMPAQD